MATVTFDELKAMTGQVIGTSDWLTVSQEMIDKFADATGDHQFIHIDPEAAAKTPFGTTIAHGFLSLSLMPVLTAKADLPRMDGIKMGVNYGGNKTRFLSRRLSRENASAATSRSSKSRKSAPASISRPSNTRSKSKVRTNPP